MNDYIERAAQAHRERETETRIRAMETHEIVSEIHSLEDATESAGNEIERLRRIISDVAEALEHDRAMYVRNGPQWTSAQGNEYESTSDVLACSDERAAILRDALNTGVLS